MDAKFVRQWLAEVHRSHGVPEGCKCDGLEPAAGPGINGSAAVSGDEDMGGKKFLLFYGSDPPFPRLPGNTSLQEKHGIGLAWYRS